MFSRIRDIFRQRLYELARKREYLRSLARAYPDEYPEGSYARASLDFAIAWYEMKVELFKALVGGGGEAGTINNKDS